MVMLRYFITLLTLFVAYSALAQKPRVEIIVEQSEVEVGNQFNIIVKSNIVGELNINLPNEFDLGPNVFSNSNIEIDGVTGNMIHNVMHGKSGSIHKAGNYTIGPAYIRQGNKVYRSNKVKIKVVSEGSSEGASIDDNIFRKPATGVIEIEEKKVYCGEVVVLQPTIYSKFEPSGFVDYNRCAFSTSVDQHFLGKPDEVSSLIKTIQGRQCYQLKFNKQVVFVNSPGKVIVKPFKMTLKSGFDGYSVKAKRGHFKVIPLPTGAPNSFSGGVGEFKINHEIDKTNVKQGDIVTLTVIVSGHGNLHDISKPKINFGKNFNLYGDPGLEENFKFTSKGAEGEVRYIYHLQAIKDGGAKIPKLVMSYFDPKAKKYITATSQPEIIQVENNPSFVLKKDTVSSATEMSISRFNDKKDSSGGFFSSTAVKWVGFSAPVCAAFLFLLFRKKKEEDEPSIETETAPFASEEIQLDTLAYLSVLQSHANNGNALPFFTQLSKDLQIVTSVAAKGDQNWVLSADEKNHFFAEKEFSEDFKSLYFELQQTCELCRYGCQKPEDDLHIYVTKAKTIFETLEK